ncbi:PAQR family membrane homeostasis protein TrhA [Desulfosporosinus nitroreducens]|uniref:Hemolysin III family protein n=1 Tax=Desulfosporosinus nitroreducens TaxID=2018668 RepID=A0ABT8QN86_9FIRM|nr:hemolysin III family protein [Desulfosporosinus nitroreducens]MCO1603975.1 hemolysin III family protein [Desulfosporosinus nitroreducens]MDO0822793.1 hemolysin III family protein [Desulfosporosinus nitroreducens]
MVLKMKEPVNTWTHFVLFVAAIVGLVFLIILSKNNISKLITMTVYGVSMILLYGASSLYHWVRTTPQKELLLKKVDHIAIYLLIAGSYTPVFYYGLEGAWRWAMLSVVWGLAFIGMLLKIWFIHAPRYVSSAFYLSLGWIALVPFLQLIKNLPMGAIILMALGGLTYTVGAIIYATKICDFFPKRFGFHEIFHLFIGAGSIVHYIMILIYIIPMAE